METFEKIVRETMKKYKENMGRCLNDRESLMYYRGGTDACLSILETLAMKKGEER